MVQAKEPFFPDKREQIFHQLSCAKCGEPLPAERPDTVLVCELCGQGHKSLPPPPISRSVLFESGDGVAVQWGERWWSAHVVEALGTDRYLVHYEGWGPRHDEVVDSSRMRPLDFVPGTSIIPPKFESRLKVKRANMLSALGIIAVLIGGGVFLVDWLFHDQIFNQSGNMAEIEAARFGPITGRLPGMTLLPGVVLQAGQQVYVKWGHGWYHATVVMVEEPDEVMIQYNGWDYPNELVPRDRIRLEIDDN